jgi:hypothetical protein
MSDQFIKDLNDFCLDHYTHLKFYPIEFEWNDRVYKANEFWNYIDFDMIEANNVS